MVRRGQVDESLRKFSPDELRVAGRLAAEGMIVQALGVKDGCRTADAIVDGVETEFKRITTSNSRTVKHALNRAKRQASQVVLDAKETGLTVQDALLGVRRYLAAGPSHIESIRLDLSEGSIFVLGMDRWPEEGRIRLRPNLAWVL